MAHYPKAVLLILSIVFFCGIPGAVSADDKLNVVVTILPEAEFVEKVGAEHVNVSVMVPPGANPHTYEPTPLQLKKVESADLYFKIGAGIEFELVWLDKLISLNKNLQVVDMSRGITTLDAAAHEADKTSAGEIRHAHTGKDPHIWLSPKNVMIMVDGIRGALIEKDPQHKDVYNRNAGEYLKELEGLDFDIRAKLKHRQGMSFMVFHPAWAYFARDYGLKELAIESEGKEPTIAGLSSIIEAAKKNGIKVIFVSPQFSRKSSEVVAREINGKVVSVDDLSKDYIDNMRYVTGLLEENIN